jgi:hypothetical protein
LRAVTACSWKKLTNVSAELTAPSSEEEFSILKTEEILSSKTTRYQDPGDLYRQDGICRFLQKVGNNPSDYTA